MSLDENIDLILKYSSSETFIVLWYERHKENNIIEKTKEKLKTFNYLINKLEDRNETNINKIIELLTKDWINKKEKNTHPGFVFYYLIEEIKKHNITLGEVNFNEVENQALPSYEMNHQLYEEMIKKVEKNYEKTYFYQIRKQRSEDFANKGIRAYVTMTGEILTELFAKEYIKNYTNKRSLNYPQAYIKTYSGKIYFEKINKTWFQKIRNIFNKYNLLARKCN